MCVVSVTFVRKQKDVLALSGPELKRKDFIQSFTDALTNRSAGGRLQPRDYEIMRFILDQKFCSLEAIYFRFFDTRKSQGDGLPKNLWTTRQRLSKLRHLGLIKTEKVLSSGRAHFLLTLIGHKVVASHAKDTVLIRPTKSIDFSLYEHDTRITLIRALTEAKGKASHWYSDKWLKASPIQVGEKHTYHFAKDLRPDAVFVNSKAEKIALELEVARKTRTRIEEKIRLFDELLEENYHRDSRERFKVLDKVWFIATKPVVFRFLHKMIEARSRHPLCYRVDFYDDIVPAVARG